MNKHYFFDTSALFKLYNNEVGTEWVRQIYRNPNMFIYISEITSVEVNSAFSRRIQPKSEIFYRVLIEEFKQDKKRRFLEFKLDGSILEKAQKIALNRGLRGYDNIQLASAIKAKEELAIAQKEFDLKESKTTIIEFIFVTADKELVEAAKIEGLSVENPNDFGEKN